MEGRSVLTISAAQIREARALLGWGTPMLSRRAGVGYEIVLRAQKEGSWPPVAGTELRAIRDAFEKAGVTFVGTDGEEPDARLRRSERIR